MKLYDASTDAVKQGGTRRGANMGILRVDHPDVLEFISCKEDLTQVTNFNISVGITSKFMEALKAGAEYELVDPVTKQVRARSTRGRCGTRWCSARGAPASPACSSSTRRTASTRSRTSARTRPPTRAASSRLLPYDVCNLGSVNVGYYVRDGQLDWEAYGRDVRTSTHFLDNIIDVNKYPLPEIDALSKRIRRIGLGVMGFADALIKLGVPYDTPEASRWAAA
jgi:ribonucleoside-diphosphate reductase alpha chain